MLNWGFLDNSLSVGGLFGDFFCSGLTTFERVFLRRNVVDEIVTTLGMTRLRQRRLTCRMYILFDQFFLW